MVTKAVLRSDSAAITLGLNPSRIQPINPTATADGQRFIDDRVEWSIRACCGLWCCGIWCFGLCCSGGLALNIGSAMGSVVPARNRCRRVDQVVLEGNEHGLGSIPGLKFAEKACHSMFDRVDGEMQLIGNFLIAESPA